MNIFVVDDRFARPMEEAIPGGLASLCAEECGSCHTAIYAEWSESMHGNAWLDPYFQVDSRFDGSQQICLNCHTPFRDQQEDLVLGFRDKARFDPILEENPDYDPSFRDEGVTCAVCHVRNGRIVGPYGMDNDAHPVQQNPDMRRGMGPCMKCHVVSGKRWDTFFRIPPCGTVAEIREAGKEPDCVGCHMAPVTRPLVTGGPPREGRRHTFPGGHHEDTVAGALSVDVKQDKKNGGIGFEITLTNTGAGHYLPTGTPDRHLTLEMALTDRNGAVLRREIHTLKRTILWRPFIIDLTDSRLPFGEPTAFTFDISPEERAKATYLDLAVRYHLLDEKRRRRIGYQNASPIAYPIYGERLRIADQ